MFKTPYTHPVILFCLFLAYSITSNAQLPNCNNPSDARNGYIYYLQNQLIWQLDPDKPGSPSNPSVNLIRPPGNANGLALGINIIQGQPRATFYISNEWGEYWYWDGNQWVNSGHKAYGQNPGFGGSAIFNNNDSTGRITKYTGSANPQFTGTYWERGAEDFAGDCDGNFYTYGKDPEFFAPEEDTLFKYDDNANIVHKFHIHSNDTLFFDTSDGFSKRYGFAIIEDKLYVDNKWGLWEGQMYQDSVVFGPMPIHGLNFTQRPIDWATCPIGGVGNMNAKISKTKDYSCGMWDSVLFSKVDAPTCVANWSIVGGGTATLTPTVTGDSVYVNASDSVRIRLTLIDTYYCNKPFVFDADVIPVTATIDAGTDRHLIGCSPFIDTLDGSLINTQRYRGIFYVVSWNPPGLYQYVTPNRLAPQITINKDTSFILTVFTPQHQGGCYWHDTVNVTVEDYREDNIAFEYDVRYGCEVDTINFTNQTTTAYGPLTSKWFAESSLFSTSFNSSNTYPIQDSQNVLLVTNNGYCDDSLTKKISTEHPLKAAFNVAKEVPCVEQLVAYSADSSITFDYPYGDTPTYNWNFNGYRFDEGKTIAHAFPAAEQYYVKLIVTDGIGCKDSIQKNINVFGLMPVMNLGPVDTVACDDHEIYLPFGSQGRVTSYLWQDGSRDSVYHVVEPGIYTIKASNDCGSVEDSIRVGIGGCKIWMPNAFTPNGDSKNDKFGVFSRNPQTISDIHFAIFNRKGNLVFETQSANDGWDGTYNGKPQPIGTYYYMLEYTIEGEQHFDKGDVTLIR